MKIKQLIKLLNGSCRQLSPKILFHKHFGGPPIGVTHSWLSLLLLSAAFVVSFATGINMTINTSALTYSENVDVNFTFEPSINVSLSSSVLIIEDLVPGSASDSNVINIEVSTNNITGYTLSANTGNGTTYTNTNLINTNDIKNTDIFTSLATNTDISDITNINPGYWGYAYATSSNSNDWSWSNYSGLPYYGSGFNKELVSSNTNGESSVKFKIAANADNWQLAGEYNNVINFYAVTNLPPPYMQEATMSDCGKIMMDKRDTKIYTTALINGQCWMTQNLRVTGTISAEYSNFTGNDFNVSEYSLDANDASYANHCDSNGGWNNACAKDSNSDTTGVWYNYYSATAGAISGNSNTAPVTQDICPAGWHLPSGPNITEGTDFNKLVGNTTSGWQPATSGIIAFNVVAGGWYKDGSLSDTHYGVWWQANLFEIGNLVSRYDLAYDTNNNQSSSDGTSMRYRGFYIRCVRNDN